MRTLANTEKTPTFVKWFFHNSIRFKVNKVGYGMS